MALAIDGVATSASERYVSTLNQFRDALRFAMQRDPRDARTRSLLRRTLRDHAISMRDFEIAAMEDEIQRLMDQAKAQVMTDMSVTGDVADLAILEDYPELMVDHASTELTSQLQRDMASTVRELHEFTLEVFAQRQTGVSEDQAHATALVNAKDRVSYVFRDRAGRRLQSQKFVRTMTRHTLLITYLEAYAAYAAAFGADHMVVVHPDASASQAGMKVGLRREDGLPLVSDLQDEVFHPNSLATLKAVP